MARAPDARVIELVIHWKGGKHTALCLPRNRIGQHRRSTSRDVLEVIRELARCLPDAQIARVLNRLGYRTGAGNTWTEPRVTSLRSSHGIAVFRREVDRAARLTLAEAAGRLGVSTATVRRMIMAGVLPATQPVPYAPWAIRPEDLGAEAVQRAVETVKQGRAFPRTTSEAQLPLIHSRT